MSITREERIRQLLEMLLAQGDGSPPLEAKLALLAELRMLRATVDEPLLRQAHGLGQAVAEARALQGELRGMIDALLAPPWYPARFLRALSDAPPRALVMQGGGLRAVACTDGVDLAELAVGDEVFLAKDGGAIVARAATPLPRCGETATFERRTDDGRLVLRVRDEELIVDPAARLGDAVLQRGDLLRWDRAAWLAVERMEPDRGPQILFEDVPDIGRECVGGQDAALDALLGALTARLVAPELAARYRLGGRQSILMYGPPGCGKTLMARVAAAEMQRLSGRRCRLAVVKPAAWEQGLVGATQAEIRRTFAALRDAAHDGYAILFLDEVEAVGRTRGGLGNHFSDKFLASLLAELDGFSDRAGVAVIAAGNRKDLIDPALLERLSDVEIAVSRPPRATARAIFAVHLDGDLPYSPNGSAASATRDALIDTALSRLYAPNGGGELCTMRLRDGATRTVWARELLSGRIIEQICRAARRAAFRRHAAGGAPGVGVADMEEAVADAIERLATTLSARNARSYLADLPQDVDVVSVEPVVRRPARPHRYVRAA
jgi:proteasome-associated ATPase